MSRVSAVVLGLVAVLAISATGYGAPILFDFNVGGSPTNAGWNSAGSTGGTAGPVSIAITPVGSVSIDGRERGTAGTPQGVDNNDIQVPAGVYADMYRDFIFAIGSNTTSEGMDIAVTGLAPSTDYNVTVWSYDSGSHSSARSANWGQAGGSTVTLPFEGDHSGAAPGPDPNTNLLTDYSATFRMTSDASGAAIIEGRSTPGFTYSHNVFINGIGIDEATGPAPPPPPPPSEFKIDIDVDSAVTEPGWTSLRVTSNRGSAAVDGTTFQVFSADGSRNRSGPNALTRDFVYDNGSGQATGLQVFGLPAGRWQAEVWAYDSAVPPGDQFVGITRFPGETIFTDSFTMDPTAPYTFVFGTSALPNSFGIFTRENNSRNESRFNALRLSPAPPITQLAIDLDVGANVTEPGFVSLPVSNNAGSVMEQGVTFTVFSADGSRDRGGPNGLTRDFVFDDGSGQAAGLTIRDLPDAAYVAEVWAWDQAAAAGDQIVGITQFGGGPEIIFSDSFAANPTDPYVFTFDSTNLPEGFGIFTRENNSANRSRFNALRLTTVQQAPDGGLDLKIDFNDRAARGAANTQPGFEEFFLYGGGTPQTQTMHYPGATVTVSGVGVNLDDRRRTQPVNGGAFDQQELLRDFIFAINPGAEDESMDILFEGLMPGLLHEVTIWSFDDGSPQTRTSDWFANGVLAFDDYTFNGTVDPTDNGMYSFSFLANADLDGNLLVTGTSRTTFSHGLFLDAIELRAIPEPTTLALLGLGALALVRRRRK